jgi:hypothetical protein
MVAGLTASALAIALTLTIAYAAHPCARRDLLGESL